MKRYFSNGREFESVFAAVQYGDLMGCSVFQEARHRDPVRDGVFIYRDGGWEDHGPLPGPRPIPEDYTNPNVPVCQPKCPYLLFFEGYGLQQNALRTETAHMVSRKRCGWNLKRGVIGGHALDYAPCTY